MEGGGVGSEETCPLSWWYWKFQGPTSLQLLMIRGASFPSFWAQCPLSSLPQFSQVWSKTASAISSHLLRNLLCLMFILFLQ